MNTQYRKNLKAVMQKSKEYTDNIYTLATNNIAGKDTSANILAKTSDAGIWVGSDTGNWYYWNGTNYVSGGVYLSDVNNDIINSNIDNLVLIASTEAELELEYPSNRENKYANYSTGKLVDSTNYDTTSHIAINSDFIKYIQNFGGNAGICFYSSTNWNSFIIGYQRLGNYGDVRIIEVPTNAKYFVISRRKDYTTDTKVYSVLSSTNKINELNDEINELNDEIIEVNDKCYYYSELELEYPSNRENKYANYSTGKLVIASNYDATSHIAINSNFIKYTQNFDGNAGICFYSSTNWNSFIIGYQRLGDFGSDRMIEVPDNAKYFVISRRKDYTTNTKVYSVYTLSDIANIVLNPDDYVLTKMPEYVQNDLSYRALGSLSKAYFCLSVDDGSYELASYTIPMLANKNMKCTFSLMSDSEVCNNQTYLDAVLTAVSNGCSVAQHGARPWASGTQAETPYDEKTLNEFFEAEKTALNNLGIYPKGAVYPYGYVNSRVMAQVGGLFGVSRSIYEYIPDIYPYHCLNGSRSNIYALSSYNIKFQNLQYWKDAVDYAISHKLLMCVYFHDWDLSSDVKIVLEGLIDYVKAKSSDDISIINIEDIPNII